MTDFINNKAIKLKEELKGEGLRSKISDKIIDVIQQRSQHLKF